MHHEATGDVFQFLSDILADLAKAAAAGACLVWHQHFFAPFQMIWQRLAGMLTFRFDVRFNFWSRLLFFGCSRDLDVVGQVKVELIYARDRSNAGVMPP